MRKILYPTESLTKEERKNFKKDHPGYRLALRDRFPNFPLYLSIAAIVISSVQLWIALWCK